jgi:hypothetical protein
VHVHEIVTFMCGMFIFYLRINQSLEANCKVYTNLCGLEVRWKVHNNFFFKHIYIFHYSTINFHHGNKTWLFQLKLHDFSFKKISRILNVCFLTSFFHVYLGGLT